MGRLRSLLALLTASASTVTLLWLSSDLRWLALDEAATGAGVPESRPTVPTAATPAQMSATAAPMSSACKLRPLLCRPPHTPTDDPATVDDVEFWRDFINSRRHSDDEAIPAPGPSIEESIIEEKTQAVPCTQPAVAIMISGRPRIPFLHLGTRILEPADGECQGLGRIRRSLSSVASAGPFASARSEVRVKKESLGRGSAVGTHAVQDQRCACTWFTVCVIADLILPVPASLQAAAHSHAQWPGHRQCILAVAWAAARCIGSLGRLGGSQVTLGR